MIFHVAGWRPWKIEALTETASVQTNRVEVVGKKIKWKILQTSDCWYFYPSLQVIESFCELRFLVCFLKSSKVLTFLYFSQKEKKAQTYDDCKIKMSELRIMKKAWTSVSILKTSNCELQIAKEKHKKWKKWVILEWEKSCLCQLWLR